MLILYNFTSYKHIFSFIILIILLSCNKEVNYEIKHSSKLVVNATLNQNGIFVTVSKSISSLTTLPSAEELIIHDAVVTLNSNSVTFNLEKKGNGNFSYSDTSLLKEGNVYELQVSVPGFETVTSRVLNENLNEIPQDGAVKGVELFTDDGQRLQTYDIKVKNSLDDDYYFIRHSAVSTVVGDFIYNLYGFTEFKDITEVPPCDYTVIYAVKGISPYFLISDGCFGSSQYINESIYVNEEIDGGQSDPQEVIIEVSACSKEYFNYLKAKKRTEFDADSNNFPDISPGNIVNGFGFFRILKTRKFIF